VFFSEAWLTTVMKIRMTASFYWLHRTFEMTYVHDTESFHSNILLYLQRAVYGSDGDNVDGASEMLTH
jgi:hypothetical protein